MSQSLHCLHVATRTSELAVCGLNTANTPQIQDRYNTGVYPLCCMPKPCENSSLIPANSGGSDLDRPRDALTSTRIKSVQKLCLPCGNSLPRHLCHQLQVESGNILALCAHQCKRDSISSLRNTLSMTSHAGQPATPAMCHSLPLSPRPLVVFFVDGYFWPSLPSTGKPLTVFPPQRSGREDAAPFVLPTSEWRSLFHKDGSSTEHRNPSCFLKASPP